MAKKNTFFKDIANANKEEDVRFGYNTGISLYFPNVTLEHELFGTDTHFQCKVKYVKGEKEDGTEDMFKTFDIDANKGNLLKFVAEYKYDVDLKDAYAQAKVLCQVLFYLKKFIKNGQICPNVCMVGDKNECFVMHTNPLTRYINEDVDWSISPSAAYKVYPELVEKIANDENIHPWVYDINDKSSFNDISKKIVREATDIVRLIPIDENNVSVVFDYFVSKIIKHPETYSANDLVAIFMGAICDKTHYHESPEAGIFVTPKFGDVSVDSKKLNTFVKHFRDDYTPEEKKKLAEVSDRLIEDTNRRKKGEFYTPTLFVNYAHEMLSNKFGKDWKEKYVVWDNCCGTKNLTRDYRFAELYCSTLENAELEISKKYNKEAVDFQFDFLNDSLDKLPMGLKKAIEENKPIIFFINPPYATSASGKGKEGKEGVSNTMVYDDMIAKNIGSCSQNLYAQFLYRITDIKKQYNLTNIHIALFCKPNYLSGNSYKNFRNEFFKHFTYSNGVLFNASEFADVSDKWGINFTIWDCGENSNKKDFVHTLISNKDGEIVADGTKNIYNVDAETRAGDWVRKELKDIKEEKVLFPHLANSLKVSDKDNQRLLPNSIGSICVLSNDVAHNGQGVAIFSSIQTQGTACISNSIIPQNFGKCISLFSARKLIVGNWINDKDEYLAPNTEDENYKEFENDSIIYSLFNTSSNQSSLRNIDYKGKKWNIKNEFFFMSKDEMSKLANENRNDECYNDACTSTDRFVFAYLKGIELSEEAQVVLEKAKEIVRKTFKYRRIYNNEHPEYQINNWDCGWYQVKALAKEYAPADLKEFIELYKKLSDKMRPMVYALGFLK